VILGDQLKKTIFGGFMNISLGYGLALTIGILASGTSDIPFCCLNNNCPFFYNWLS